MKLFIRLTITFLTVFALLTGKQMGISNSLQKQMLVHNSNAVEIKQSPANEFMSTREEIDLWTEDFESGENGWSLDDGWNITDASYNSETHSANSPNDLSTMNGQFNLITPTIELPAIADDETMNFGFWLWTDMPDCCSSDGFLEDYYSISLLDIDALAWHATEFNADEGGGSNFWAADEEVASEGGYLDSWMQFLDTPSISLGSNGSLNARLFYAIEDPAGAVVAGTCTDGWDSANIRVSTDGGVTWVLLEDPANPYHFDCGYGWLWNDGEYDTGGSLNHLAPGWGGMSDDGHGGGWLDFSADLSAYTDEDVIIRFAFGSDPAYSTPDDGEITGFQVDAISVEDNSGVLFTDAGDDMSQMTATGEVWIDQFYDYSSTDDGRPGSAGWEEFLPGLAFNGNTFMDISDFAGKSVLFRIQTRYDGDNTGAPGGQGEGFYIDDFRIYKVSGGSCPAPTGLAAESGDESAILTWADMNASGTEDFIYDNDIFDNGTSGQGAISMVEGTGWAGGTFNIVGASTINTAWVFNSYFNDLPTTTTFAAYGALGSLFDTAPAFEMEITLTTAGWNEIDVPGWEMNNPFILATMMTADIAAELDVTAIPSEHSMWRGSGGWETWQESIAGTALPDGEWGIRANITFAGADVLYNVYSDEASVASGLSANNYTDTGLTNNIDYEYTISATYQSGACEGSESDPSDPVVVTPQAQTVHEMSYDDGTAETQYNAGSGNQSAVKFSACAEGEQVMRYKWFQFGDGGAFYLNIWSDDNGMPGEELENMVLASGLVDGWNEKDLSEEGIILTGNFWVGIQEFSSTMPMGLDTDSGNSGNSFQNTGDGWTEVAGNIMYRVMLDGVNCEEMSNENNILPESFAINQVYPNPFNPMVTLNYGTPEAGHVNIAIFNINGRKVADLFNGYVNAGYHQISWNAGKDAASGIYFIAIQSQGNVVKQKLMLLK